MPEPHHRRDYTDGTPLGCGLISESVIEGVAMFCRHCGRARVNRPRGLCWSCYYTPGIRERYPSHSKFARRGVGIAGGRVPLPLTPTRARPGTPEKMRVLEQRARNHQSLWHPDDAPMDPESYLIGA